MVVAMLVAPGLTHAFDPHVFVVGGDGSTGEASTLTINAPWTATPDVESVGGVPIVRNFFGLHYVVNRDSGTIQVIDPETFDTIADYAVGSGRQDIAFIGARQSPAIMAGAS